MRPLAFTAFAVFAAASLAAAPVYAQERHHHGAGGGGGQHHFGGGGGGGGERHHGGGGVGFAAPALILGLGAAAVGAAIANGHRNSYDDESCGGHYERVYDDWGNYRGKRFVSDC